LYCTCQLGNIHCVQETQLLYDDVVKLKCDKFPYVISTVYQTSKKT